MRNRNFAPTATESALGENRRYALFVECASMQKIENYTSTKLKAQERNNKSIIYFLRGALPQQLALLAFRSSSQTS